MSSTFERMLKLTVFGESHGPAVGMVLDNLPAREELDLEELSSFTARRRAKKGDGISTERTETDIPEFLSGLYQGKTTGTPLAAIIRNQDLRSEDYTDLSASPRPGHADLTGKIRYRGANDPRGGGHFSGRLTAPLTLAGGICSQILSRRGIAIGSHILSVGTVSEARFDPVGISGEELKRLGCMDFPVLDPASEAAMRKLITSARDAGDSVGGVVECCITGLPAGIGSPMFGGVENVLSSLIFGIPAVKGIEFGDGFASAGMKGSEHNDGYTVSEDGTVGTSTNHHGGIIGGISSGMPVIFRVAFKPTPSIALPQTSVDLSAMKEKEIQIGGRHDPCVAVRAAVVVEAAAAVAALDLMLEHGKIGL